jgi:hypothetical protein
MPLLPLLFLVVRAPTRLRIGPAAEGEGKDPRGGLAKAARRTKTQIGVCPLVAGSILLEVGGTTAQVGILPR